MLQGFNRGDSCKNGNSPCCHALCSGEADRLGWDEGVAVSTKLPGWTQPTGPNDAQEATSSVENVHRMPVTCPWLRPWARCRTSCDASCAPDAPATRCVPPLDRRWPSSAGCQRRSLPLPWPWPVGSAHGTFRESGQRRSTACLSATACVPACLSPLAFSREPSLCDFVSPR